MTKQPSNKDSLIDKIKQVHTFLNKNQTMSNQFAWITTALIAIVSLLISISVMSFFAQLTTEIQQQAKEQDLYVSSKIYDTVVKYYKNDKEKMQNELAPSLKSGVIAYVTIYDRHTNRIVYSIDATRKYKIKDKDYQEYAPEYISKDLKIIVGFFEKNYLKNSINNFINKLSILTTSGIFFGLLMSYFMFKIVNKPLEELTVAAEKFRHGNFKIHIENSNYVEINSLIKTYNAMGESLNELYTSLELKVEKRTLELEKAYKELKDTQTMMVHSEKMRSLGELVAGITHEINNPVNFIYGNLIHLQNYTENMVNFIDKLITLIDANNEDLKKKLQKLRETYDYDFIKDDLPSLIKSCQDGADRTKNIIMDLKNFSRMGDKITSSIDLPSEIDTTLNILHNKIKNRITIHKDYSPDLPKIDALGGQLNQVFMNILDNATYAIKDKGNIKISMRNDEKYVTIKIEDDGCGMDEETVSRIFDPFYTTKPVGEGTGLGMSISYKVIKNHNGDIKVESKEGVGTSFTIQLPIENKEITKGV